MTNTSMGFGPLKPRTQATIATLALAMAAVAFSPAPANAADDFMPDGAWRQNCSNAHMDGHELKAYCRRADGRITYVSANVQACGGIVAYDAGQSRFYCGYRGAVVYNAPPVVYGSSVAPVIYSNPPVVYNNAAPTVIYSSGATIGYSSGYTYSTPSYVAPTYAPSYTTTYTAPTYAPAPSYPVVYGDDYRYAYGECRGTMTYSANDGRYYCTGYTDAAYGHFPSGGWKESCSNASMHGSVLRAQCQTSMGQIMTSEIDTSFCPYGVRNEVGILRCQ